MERIKTNNNCKIKVLTDKYKFCIICFFAVLTVYVFSLFQM